MSAHDVFGWVLEIFGRVWPLVGIALIMGLVLMLILVGACLLEACFAPRGAYWSGEGLRDARFQPETAAETLAKGGRD
jgi:hypothetical protein